MMNHDRVMYHHDPPASASPSAATAAATRNTNRRRRRGVGEDDRVSFSGIWVYRGLDSEAAIVFL